MERRHQLGLDSYDRFFPSQDTMPKGGFGNLIALPLQHIPRDHGNSVFLNADFDPHSKREVIVYDYVDGCLPVFSAMYSKRVRGYEAVGYVIEDE